MQGIYLPYCTQMSSTKIAFSYTSLGIGASATLVSVLVCFSAFRAV